MQSREIMQLHRFRTSPADDSWLTQTLSDVLIAFLVHRSSDVTAAFCTRTTYTRLVNKTFAIPKLAIPFTCTSEQAVLVQTVKPFGTFVTSPGSGRRFTDTLAGFRVADAHAAEHAGHKTIAFWRGSKNCIKRLHSNTVVGPRVP